MSRTISFSADDENDEPPSISSFIMYSVRSRPARSMRPMAYGIEKPS